MPSQKQMNRTYKIYCLKCPFTNEIKYIGKTYNALNKRRYEHIRVARKGLPKGAKSDWLMELSAINLKPIIELIEICDQNNWREREIYWCGVHNPILNKKKPGGGGDGERLNKSAFELVKPRLGLIHDRILAEEINVDRKTIVYYRQQLGIKALGQDRKAPRKKGQIAHNKINIPDNIVSLLGTMPDYQLEKIAGVSKKRLMRERHKLGIKSYAEINNETGRFFKGMPHPRWSRENGNCAQ